MLVLSLSHAERLVQAGASQIRTRIGNSDYDVIELYNRYGADVCRALSQAAIPNHAFLERVKQPVLMPGFSLFAFPKLKESANAFIELCNPPSCISTENLNILGKFVVFVYFGKEHTYTDINEARRISFFKSPPKS